MTQTKIFLNLSFHINAIKHMLNIFSFSCYWHVSNRDTLSIRSGMSGTQTSGVFPTTSEHIPPLALNENPSYDAVTAQLQRSYRGSAPCYASINQRFLA